MQRLFMKLEETLNKRNFSFYTSVFRVLIGLVLLIDLLLIVFNKHDDEFGVIYLTHNSEALLRFLSNNLQLFQLIYAGIIILFILGIGKRIISFLLLVFYILHFSLLGLNFFGDIILFYTLMYFAFINSFNYLSLYKSTKFGFISKVGVLFIQIHVCYLYVINIINKFSHIEWIKGEAIYNFFKFESSVDIFSIGQFIIDNNLAKILTISTLIYQFTFPLLIWFKKTKYFMIFIGIIIHSIMAFVLQVYKFEIIVILHYGFFISNKEWNRLIPWMNIK